LQVCHASIGDAISGSGAGHKVEGHKVAHCRDFMLEGSSKLSGKVRVNDLQMQRKCVSWLQMCIWNSMFKLCKLCSAVLVQSGPVTCDA
jgi:hypothetical protein